MAVLKPRALVLVSLLLAFPPVNAQETNTNTGDESTNATCPDRRTFDPFQAAVDQSPDNCVCKNGLSLLNCGYCGPSNSIYATEIVPLPEIDPCKAHNESLYCRHGYVFAEDDTYKAYQCKLGPTLASLFTGADVALEVDRLAQTVTIAVYKTYSGVNGEHTLHCDFTNCTFANGETGGHCGRAMCHCGSLCSDFTKFLVQDMFAQGKPATFVMEAYNPDKIVDEVTGEEVLGIVSSHSLISVEIEGAPMPLEAVCDATTCTLDPNATDPELAAAVEQPLSQWGTSTTVALVVLLVVFGGFGSMAVLACLCAALCGRVRSGKKNDSSHPEEVDPLTTSSSIDSPTTTLQFTNISTLIAPKMRLPLPRQAQDEPKTILKNVRGSVRSGNVLGIMGPSGSGKTTLLNTLAATANGRRAQTTGTILFQGQPMSKNYRRIVAYVQQGDGDSLYETLTVRECLEYSALLRLSTPYQQRQDQVDATLQELHLERVANSRIGSASGGGGQSRGISGGERRRVSIGMELVTQPKVLVLDEPTSGLDSFVATNTVTLLAELASRNRIVIMSIHQPSLKSFLALDQVLMLTEGRIIYSGASADAQQYLEDRGFNCPPSESLPDYMLEVVSDPSNRKALLDDAPPHVLLQAASDPANCEASLEAQQNNDNKSRRGSGIDEGEQVTGKGAKVHRRSIINELAVLFARTAKDIFRNRTLFILQLVISILVALFAGAIFFGVENNLAGFQNRMGAFYFTLSFFGFSSFSSMDVFIRERSIFTRETGSQYYRTGPYFLAKTLLDCFLLRVIPITVFVILFYWVMKLKNTVEAFLIFWATLVLFNICAGIMSICISIAAPTVGAANLIAAVWFLIMLLFGGFLLNIQTMDPAYAWLKYLSIFYYSFELLMTNELSYMLITFDAPGYPAIPTYGEVYIATIGMSIDNQTRDLICLCGLALGFGALAYVLLLLRVPTSATRHVENMNRNNKRLTCQSKTNAKAMKDGNALEGV